MAKLELSGMPTAEDAPRVIGASPRFDLSLGSVIDGRYEIRARLGAGGMGAVYRAHDRELHEDIALKVVLPDRLQNPGAIERLRREVKLARQITHPNACRVFDLGESDGLYFLTMELVDGRTLRELLIEGRLPPGRALDLLIQIASGVAPAHAKGIIHRDLKPENVLVRGDGVAVVADFGIAHQAQPGAATAAAREGTPAYMSPEQLRGEPIDVRSDVYALGVLGFEMLGGRRPFGDELPAAIAAAPARPAAKLDIVGFPEPVVAALQTVLERAIAERPEDRFASAVQFAEPLIRARQATEQGVTEPASVVGHSPRGRRGAGFWLVWSAVLGVVVLGGITLTLQRTGVQRAPDTGLPVAIESEKGGSNKAELSQPAVLLLPFENRTGDPAWDGLAHSATETVGAGLRTVAGLRVLEAPAEHSAAPAKATGQPTWVARGSVQRVGNGVRLAAQFKSETGSASSEPIEIDGEPSILAERLRTATIDEARLLVRNFDRHRRAEHGTDNPTARARLFEYMQMVGPAPRREHFQIGLTLLDEALAADPDYIPATVERAYLRSMGAGRGSAEERTAAASADLDRAAALDSSDPTVAVMRCRVLQVATVAAERLTDAAINRALDACQLALKADPASGYVPITLARIHDRACRDEEAMRLLEQSLELDRSLSGRALGHIVHLALTYGRIQLADRMSKQLVALQVEEQRLGAQALGRRDGAPPVRNAHFWRGAVLLRLDRLDEARREFENELGAATAGKPDKPYEAAASRGLLRIAKQQGKIIAPDLTRRLARIESEFHDAVKKTPVSALPLYHAYTFVDPQAALPWIEQLEPPVSCEDAVSRALIYGNAERRDLAARMLSACTPVEAWEKSCVNAVRALVGL